MNNKIVTMATVLERLREADHIEQHSATIDQAVRRVSANVRVNYARARAATSVAESECRCRDDDDDYDVELEEPYLYWVH
jgi:hypothetical protein